MWKKPDDTSDESTPPPSFNPIERSVEKGERAVIGASISVKGDISGAEDLLVQGFVEGTINLKQNVVTIGKNGRVTANVFGKVIRIEGEVNGDCLASDQIVVHKSGNVKGNITAPRVTLEDGARLRGAIDTSSSVVDIPAEAGRSTSDTKQKAAPQAQNQKREGTTQSPTLSV